MGLDLRQMPALLGPSPVPGTGVTCLRMSFLLDRKENAE